MFSASWTRLEPIDAADLRSRLCERKLRQLRGWLKATLDERLNDSLGDEAERLRGHIEPHSQALSLGQIEGVLLAALNFRSRLRDSLRRLVQKLRTNSR